MIGANKKKASCKKQGASTKEKQASMLVLCQSNNVAFLWEK
jgi:hypothetical protein